MGEPVSIQWDGGGSHSIWIVVLMIVSLAATCDPRRAAAEGEGPGLLGPDIIRIYDASADLTAQDLEDLKARLECRFYANVQIFDGSVLRLGPDQEVPKVAYNKTRQQYYIPWLLDYLVRVLTNPEPGIIFKFVIVDFDLWDNPYTYLFGSTRLRSKVGLYSTYRLSRPVDATGELGPGRSPEILVERLDKLLSKNAARMAGLSHSERCIMRWPDDLPELDAIPNEFCEPDWTALRDAGIFGSCYGVMVMERDRNFLVQTSAAPITPTPRVEEGRIE